MIVSRPFSLRLGSRHLHGNRGGLWLIGTGVGFCEVTASNLTADGLTIRKTEPPLPKRSRIAASISRRRPEVAGLWPRRHRFVRRLTVNFERLGNLVALQNFFESVSRSMTRQRIIISSQTTCGL